MKNLLPYILMFAMGIVCAWAFMSATAETQAIREASILEREYAACHTGSHCKIGEKEFLTITAGRGK